MNKEFTENKNKYHKICINERKEIILTGIIKINSFTDQEFIIETNFGLLGLKGNNLEIVKLDVIEGLLTIKGSIDGLTYLNEKYNNKESFIKRLFK